MNESILKDLYCFDCFLLFDEKCHFDKHLSKFHHRDIKVIPETVIQSRGHKSITVLTENWSEETTLEFENDIEFDEESYFGDLEDNTRGQNKILFSTNKSKKFITEDQVTKKIENWSHDSQETTVSEFETETELKFDRQSCSEDRKYTAHSQKQITEGPFMKKDEKIKCQFCDVSCLSKISILRLSP